jgi:hypothetical protein
MVRALQLTLSVSLVLWLMVLELPFTVISRRSTCGRWRRPELPPPQPRASRIKENRNDAAGRAQTKFRRRERALHR